jgi:Na+-translocating ferredoxin:NAD+ oxidoreductase subunit A
MSWVGIIVTFALIDNVILSRLLGVCPCVGAPGAMRGAVRVGLSTGLLMCVSALAAWVLNAAVIQPLGLGFLRTPVFTLCVAGFAFLIELTTRRFAPALLSGVGFSLPGVTINCAALGVVLITVRGGYSPLEALVAGASAGLGFLLVQMLLTAIRERLEVEQVPAALRGLPLHFVSAGLLAYAFMAFDRAFLARLFGG